jgi:hypothetical protein
MPNTSRLPRWILAVVVTAPVGCYDGAVLLTAHRGETDTNSLDEIDLGEFRISLVAPRGEADAGLVEFHVFGQVARRDRDEVAELLAKNEPEWRRRILLLVRGLVASELDEPKLETLRSGIHAAANAALATELIKSVGFYRFSFATR